MKNWESISSLERFVCSLFMLFLQLLYYLEDVGILEKDDIRDICATGIFASDSGAT